MKFTYLRLFLGIAALIFMALGNPWRGFPTCLAIGKWLLLFLTGMVIGDWLTKAQDWISH